jgi:hypothetical protein
VKKEIQAPQEDPGKKTPESAKKWYEAYYYMAAWLPLSLAAIGGLVYYFWEDIKGWFGTSEEAGKDEESE